MKTCLVLIIVPVILVLIIYLLNIWAIVLAWRAHKELLAGAGTTIVYSGGSPVMYNSVQPTTPAMYTAPGVQPVYNQPGGYAPNAYQNV